MMRLKFKKWTILILSLVFFLLIGCGNDKSSNKSPAGTPTPDAPVISGIVNGSFNTNQSFTITGQDGAELEYTLDGGSNWETYTGAVTFSIDGTYTVSARQTVNGKTSASTVTIQVIINKTLPDPPVISGISTGYFKTSQTITVTGTSSLVEYSIDGGSSWSGYTVPVLLSAEQLYTVTVRQSDVLGNVSASSTPIVLTIDKTNPAPPVIGGIVTGTYNINKSFTISGETGSTINYRTSGSTWTAYSDEVTLSAEGSYTITAYQTDLAGNVSANADAINVTIDKIPSAPVITGLAAGLFNAGQTITITGTESNIQYSINGGIDWNSYSSSVTLSAEQAYTVVAKQIDPAGNVSALSTSYAFTIDKTAPADVTGLGATASNQKITLNWTEPAGDVTFSKVRITFTPTAGVTQPIEVLKGITTAQITPLINGTEYTFTVKSVDTAGNESSGVVVLATAAAVIDIAAINGVTPPSYNVAPVTTITETAQYTGTVTWSGSPAAFAASTSYTATITLTAKSGYTLTGVAANFFTVAGVTSDANNADSGVVTAVFPATESIFVMSGTGGTAGNNQSFTKGTLVFNMKYVHGGTFPVGIYDEEHQAIYTPYWMAETEVTYALWNAVRTWATNASIDHDGDGTTGDDVYTFANAGVQGSTGSLTDQHPVTTINWRDSMVWCNALTEYYNANNGTDTDLDCAYYINSDNTTPIRAATDSVTIMWDAVGTYRGTEDDPYVKSTAKGFRLPGSAEWECAARYKNESTWTAGSWASGGTGAYIEAAATNYPNFNPFAWYGNSLVSPNGNTITTQPVATVKTANFLGIRDMSGNVWEWCFDWYPELEGSVRVVRGGGWEDPADWVQVGYCGSHSPDGEYNALGFRFVRTQ